MGKKRSEYENEGLRRTFCTLGLSESCKRRQLEHYNQESPEVEVILYLSKDRSHS